MYYEIKLALILLATIVIYYVRHDFDISSVETFIPRGESRKPYIHFLQFIDCSQITIVFFQFFHNG